MAIVYGEENADLLVDLDREVEDWDWASPAYDNLSPEEEAAAVASDCDRSTHTEGGGQSPGHRASLEIRGRACPVAAEEVEVARAVMRWSRERHRWRAFCCY